MTDTKTNEPLPVGGGCAECGAKEGWPHSETCYELLRKLRESAQPAPPIIASFQTIIGTLEPIREGNWRVSKAITLLRIMQEEATQPDTAGGDVDAVKHCLTFFRSVILSGEPWTATCQRDFDIALKALSPKPAPDKGSVDDVERVKSAVRKALVKLEIERPPMYIHIGGKPDDMIPVAKCEDALYMAWESVRAAIAALRDNPGEVLSRNQEQRSQIEMLQRELKHARSDAEGYKANWSSCEAKRRAEERQAAAQPKPQGGEG